MDNLFPDERIENLLLEDAGEQQRDDSAHLEYTNELTESKVLETIQKYESQWDRTKSAYEKDLRVHYNAYRTQEIMVDGVSVKIPEIFSLVETELPHLLNSIFGQSLIVDATPKFKDPDGSKTYKVKNYVNRTIKDTCSGRKKTESIIKNLLIYGFSPVKVYWDTTPDKDIDVFTGEIVEVNSAHPNFDLVDPFTWAYDTNNTSHEISNCEWVRERIFMSKEKLKVLRDNGQCAWFDDDDMSTAEDKGKKTRDKSDTDSQGSYYDEYSATMYDKTEDGKMISKEYIVWVLAGNKVIKFIENPQKEKMYAFVRAYQNPNEFLGVGESEILGPLAQHISYVHYQIGKLAKKVGQHLTKVTPQAGISPENLRRIEDGVIFLEDMNGIDFEKTSDAQDIRALMEMKKYLDEQVQGTTGIGPALQGESIGDVTATEASYVFQNASNRLALKLTHLQEDLIRDLAEKIFLMTKQLLEAPIEFFDANNNLIELAPEDFIGNYNWTSTGSITQANKALQLQQNAGLLAQTIQLSANTMNSANPFTVDPVYFFQQYIAPYANIADASKFIIPIGQMQGGMAPQPGQAGPPSPNQPQQGQNPPQTPLNGQSPDIGTPNEMIQQPSAPMLGNIEGGLNTIR